MLTYEILTILAESPKKLSEIRALVGDKPILKTLLYDMKVRFGYIEVEGTKRHYVYKITMIGKRALFSHKTKTLRKYILENLNRMGENDD